jgi:1-acyl-sn-glycerol-3-phosphate acyltransferase
MAAAPHTTNWDFPLMLALTKLSGVDVKWLGKASLFRGPMGPLMRRLGGIPVDRSAPGGMVAALAGEFAAHERMALIVPTEGTRSHTQHWKSGFYHIARQADVPVVCGFVDGVTRTGGLGPVIHLTGDVAADMDRFREFYAGKTGVRAERTGPVRLKEEAADSDAA